MHMSYTNVGENHLIDLFLKVSDYLLEYAWEASA